MKKSDSGLPGADSGIAGSGAAGTAGSNAGNGSTGSAGTFGSSGTGGNAAAGSGGDGASGNGNAGNGASGNGASGNGGHGGEGNDPDAAVGGDASTDIDAGTDSGTIDPLWPPPPATTELQGLPDAWAKAVCDALSSCVKPSYYDTYFDGVGCEARVKAQLADGEYVYLQASIDAGRITFDSSALAQCYSEITAQSCNVLSSRSPAHCDVALHGTVPKDGQCVIDGDCLSGMFCDRSAACPGKCADLLGENAACDRAEQCQSGKLCDKGKCRTPASNGNMCDQAGQPPCALGSVCTGADADKDTAGTCVDQNTAFNHDVGAPCDPTTGVWCKEGQACVVALKAGATQPDDLEVVCKARVASGAMCNLAFGVEQCVDGEYCPADTSKGNYTATCAARPGEGQACGVPFYRCAHGLSCRASDLKCHAVGRIGEACKIDDDCASLRCKSSKCAAPLRCRLDAVGPICGDDSCDSPDETCSNCPEDCGTCPPVCGDDKCEGSETCSNCVQDCNACPAVCGDNTCDATENCQTCAADCMACPAPYSGPCANDAACGAGKVCVKTQITSFPGFPPTVYSYCGETCSTANTCSGSAMQRTCTGNACGLHCDPFLAAFDPSQRCPVGMLCINNGCTWLN